MQKSYTQKGLARKKKQKPQTRLETQNYNESKTGTNVSNCNAKEKMASGY